jgi:hypothetical protein
MDHAPDPAHGRADEALLEIAPDQLENETTAFYQIAEKMDPRDWHF